MRPFIPRKFPVRQPRGMTLMEVVIALGVIAFVVPIILTATASSTSSRLSSEADTRSAWLSKDVYREVLAKWADPVRESVITEDLGFPAFASADAPLVLAYDYDGNFLAEGSVADIDSPSKIPKAVYLVAFYSESHIPANLAVANSSPLSLLRIRVLHPAKSLQANRSDLRYNLLIHRHGSL